MGRKALVIDKDEFQRAVSQVESEKKPSSLNELWKLVAETDWAINREKPYNKSTLQVKAKTLGIVVTTQRGALRSNKGMNAGPKKKKSFPLHVIEDVKKEFSPLGEKSVTALIDGKMSAAIKAKCWDCSGHMKVEVANCVLLTCPLWPHRPWRRRNETTNKMSHEMDDSSGHAIGDEDSEFDQFTVD